MFRSARHPLYKTVRHGLCFSRPERRVRARVLYHQTISSTHWAMPSLINRLMVLDGKNISGAA